MALRNTSYGWKTVKRLLDGTNGVWFLGVGGVSMSALAEATIRLGKRVGGSDRVDSERIDALRSMGAEIRIGEADEIPEGFGAVVYTVAIRETDPQYRYAKEHELPCISRADYLDFLTFPYRNRVGIAGMHGKSTCTAMCANVLLAAGDATVFAGAELPAFGGKTCRIGSGRETVLFEACEYMDSFLDLSPTVAVVLNVGMDHVDYFRSMEQIRRSFTGYANRADLLLWNADDPESRTLFGGRQNARTFSVCDPEADFFADRIGVKDGKIAFNFCERGKEPIPVCVPAVGRHNVCNALAAAGAARMAGVPAEKIAPALASFRGVERRMEYRGELNGCPVYDDYAHHPDEIKATLAGARELVKGGGRLVCVYQPHTYSRTAGLFEDFARSFGGADEVLFTNIYAAREINTCGVTAQELARATEAKGVKANYAGDLAQTAKEIPGVLKEGDLLLIMGAGDVEELFGLLPLTKRTRTDGRKEKKAPSKSKKVES